jgi:hypothetical protein
MYWWVMPDPQARLFGTSTSAGLSGTSRGPTSCSPITPCLYNPPSHSQLGSSYHDRSLQSYRRYATLGAKATERTNFCSELNAPFPLGKYFSCQDTWSTRFAVFMLDYPLSVHTAYYTLVQGSDWSTSLHSAVLASFAVCLIWTSIREVAL